MNDTVDLQEEGYRNSEIGFPILYSIQKHFIAIQNIYTTVISR